MERISAPGWLWCSEKHNLPISRTWQQGKYVNSGINRHPPFLNQNGFSCNHSLHIISPALQQADSRYRGLHFIGNESDFSTKGTCSVYSLSSDPFSSPSSGGGSLQARGSLHDPCALWSQLMRAGGGRLSLPTAAPISPAMEASCPPSYPESLTAALDSPYSD